MGPGCSELRERYLTEHLGVGHLRQPLAGNVIAFKRGRGDSIDKRLAVSRAWPERDGIPHAGVRPRIEVGVRHALVRFGLPGREVDRRVALEDRAVRTGRAIADARDMVLGVDDIA